MSRQETFDIAFFSFVMGTVFSLGLRALGLVA